MKIYSQYLMEIIPLYQGLDSINPYERIIALEELQRELDRMLACEKTTLEKIRIHRHG